MYLLVFQLQLTKHISINAFSLTYNQRSSVRVRLPAPFPLFAGGIFISHIMAGAQLLQPKPERFPGQHALGWCMLILALLMMGGATLFGAWDGIRNDFSFWRFFARFLIMFWGQKAFDIALFDWFLLCRSNFFPHYYPEVKSIIGPHLFGYNWRSYLIEMSVHIVISVILALVCTFVF